MIRSDYFLRMLAEFFEVLSRIRALQQGQNWTEADLLADSEFRKLIDGDARLAVQLSETELLARLIRSGSALGVREKTLMLTTLLKEAGALAQAQGRSEEARACHLKGLHLLLGVLGREEALSCPEFVPRIDSFLQALEPEPLPVPTQALLMQHFERNGEFGRAEDMLFSILEDQGGVPEVLELGVGFYQRLQKQSDSALAAGNLPREELEAGLAQLRQRQTGPIKPA